MSREMRGCYLMRNIAEIIEKSGNTLEDISRNSHIPISRLERLIEGATPTLAELRKLAKVLRLDFSQFIKEESAAPTALLFRNTMGNRYKASHDLTIEALSQQLEQSLEILSGEIKQKWLGDF